jgi:KaiC/GvpD/RAD55 family RecA-like ATPase
MGEILVIGGPGTGKTRMILKFLPDFKKVVWVTTIKSAEVVRRSIEPMFNIELWIIDTHTWVKRSTHTERDIIVSNPINLNEVSLAIGRVLDIVGKGYLLAFDSISGLLLYHATQRVVHFLRNILVRLESDNASGIFTLVKNAHDIHTETSVSLMFSNIIELERRFDKDVKRFIKLVKTLGYVEPEFAEFTIDKDGIHLPNRIENFIREQLKKTYA